MDIGILILGAVGGFLYAFGQKMLNLLPVLTHMIFGARYFQITQQDKAVIISRKVKDKSSELRDNQDASGFFCGFWYVGWITANEKFLGGLSRNVTLFTTQRIYDELVADPNPTLFDGDTNIITILENVSSFHIPDYKTREITLSKTANPVQQKCIDEIINAYETKGGSRNITVFLHGGVGTGKSMATLLLANSMKAIHTKDMKPSSPGMSLRTIYAAANPSASEPLILVFEEVDILLERISKVELSAHKMLTSPVVDKTSWNNMLDDIDNGLFPYMITILTSNRNPEYLNQIDPAYIRPGRVHFYFEMKPHYDKPVNDENTHCLIDIDFE